MGEAKRKRDAGTTTPNVYYGLAIGYGTEVGRVGEESCCLKVRMDKPARELHVQKAAIRRCSTETLMSLLDEVLDNRDDRVMSIKLEAGDLEQYEAEQYGMGRVVTEDGEPLTPIALAALIAALDDLIPDTDMRH